MNPSYLARRIGRDGTLRLMRLETLAEGIERRLALTCEFPTTSLELAPVGHLS
jgi:hypothetical protein